MNHLYFKIVNNTALEKGNKNYVLFIVGLFLFCTAFTLFLKGPKRYENFEHEQLSTFTFNINPYEFKEILYCNYGNYIIYCHNLTSTIDIRIQEGKIIIYVLDDIQYNHWKNDSFIKDYFLKQLIIGEKDTHSINFHP